MTEKRCCVCDSSDSKYKCPRCGIFYCSVSCCKNHKLKCSSNIPPAVASEVPKKPEELYEFPTEDTVPMEKLSQLRNSEEIKRALQNPHVRTIISSILNDRNPTDAIASAMTEPIFVELADACIKVVESGNVEST